ncbi:hypothetical protein DevBK_03610 [Devosia sp. BK]|uniref:hypothetical protein n=1 Tax=Devosia sp. BK TaxID=2871706 RepID=UPI002939F130|nr:hypothetical protein [Devosia sp. BK]MDV3250416.1 hypothetical protein [Devosia sp. BK]
MVPLFGILDPSHSQRFRAAEAPQKLSFFGGVSALTPDAIFESEPEQTVEDKASDTHFDKLENPENLLTR